MNRTIAFLILGVILLAMGLIMVNQYMNQPGDSTAAKVTAPATTEPGRSAALSPPASPEQALSQLEKKAVNSELAAKPASKPAMPAWASNAQPLSSAPKAENIAVPTPPTSVAPSATSAPASSPAMAPTEAPKAEAVKAEPAKTDTPKPQEKKVEAAKPVAEKEKPKPAPEKPKAKGPKTIKKIAVINADDTVIVRVDASEEPSYKTMNLKSPERLVVDIDGQWAIKAPGVPNNKFVTNVRIGKQGDKTRIVIDLRQPPGSIRYIKRGEGFDIRMK